MQDRCFISLVHRLGRIRLRASLYCAIRTSPYLGIVCAACGAQNVDSDSDQQSLPPATDPPTHRLPDSDFRLPTSAPRPPTPSAVGTARVVIEQRLPGYNLKLGLYWHPWTSAFTLA